jgi:Ca2+-dependent lipid-binding protein
MQSYEEESTEAVSLSSRKQGGETVSIAPSDSNLQKSVANNQSDRELRQELELFSTPGGRIKYLMSEHINRALLIAWVMIVITLSYAAGSFRLNVTLITPLFSYVLWSVMMIIRRREKQRYLAQLRDIYRSATMNTDFEDANWMNTTLSRMWGIFEPVLCRKISEALQPILEQAKFGHVSHI